MAHDLSYQKHIDGLRAVAIVWVVAYHYFPNIFPGGFIGVDVFFVISGYLISGIIWRELDEGRFSFVRFYARRIRRIFPALLTVLITTLALGFHLLHDGELMQLAKHTFAASLFLNNWALSIEKGYFDIGSEFKPLLHLWSLSIEEQFYLLWPLVLFGIARMVKTRTTRQLIVCTLLAASLIACLIQTHTRPVGAFYSPHTRIWELMAGACIHLIPTAYRLSLGRAAVWAIPVLIAGLWGLDAKLPFPGYWALLPVCCAMLLLMAPTQSLARRLLSTQPMVGLGLISYPFYLWHWPLIALGHMYLGDTLDVWARLGLIVLGLGLSIATKKFIEDPLRHGGSAQLKIRTLMIIMVVVSAFSVWTYQQSGFPARSFNQRNLSLNSGDLPSIKHLISKSCPGVPSSFECWYTPASEPAQVVVGDSKGKAFFTGLLHQTRGSDGWFYLGGNAQDGAPIPQSGDTPTQHQGLLDHTINWLDRAPHVKRVVLAVALRSLYGLKNDESVLDLQDTSPQHQAQVRQAVHAALRKLSRPGREVWVLIDNPTFLNPPKCVTRHIGMNRLDQLKTLPDGGCSMSLETHLDRTRIYRDMLFGVQNQLRQEGVQIEIIDSTPWLCDMQTQRCEMSLNGRYLYDFTDHTSAYGSLTVAKGFLALAADHPKP